MTIIKHSIAGCIAALYLTGTAFAGPSATQHQHGQNHQQHSHGDSEFGVPGDPKRKSRVVEITMKEADGKMLFEPSELRVTQGEQILFKIKNAGALKHEIVIGTLASNLAHAEEMKKNPDMEHDDPNAKELDAGTSGTLLWRFTKVGRFDFSCLIPGHREAGMFGTIIVSRKQ
jgi:uncharacterized cupredoxin-like copper-binding protein